MENKQKVGALPPETLAKLDRIRREIKNAEQYLGTPVFHVIATDVIRDLMGRYERILNEIH